MDQPLPFEIPNVTVLLQPEEQVLEIPRHKVKNVKQLLKYLGIRECTALVARGRELLTQMIKVHDMMADRLANELGISIQRGTCSDGYTPCPMHRGMMRGYHHQGMMMPMY